MNAKTQTCFAISDRMREMRNLGCIEVVPYQAIVKEIFQASMLEDRISTSRGTYNQYKLSSKPFSTSVPRLKGVGN